MSNMRSDSSYWLFGAGLSTMLGSFVLEHVVISVSTVKDSISSSILYVILFIVMYIPAFYIYSWIGKWIFSINFWASQEINRLYNIEDDYKYCNHWPNEIKALFASAWPITLFYCIILLAATLYGRFYCKHYN